MADILARSAASQAVNSASESATSAASYAQSAATSAQNAAATLASAVKKETRRQVNLFNINTKRTDMAINTNGKEYTRLESWLSDWIYVKAGSYLYNAWWSHYGGENLRISYSTDGTDTNAQGITSTLLSPIIYDTINSEPCSPLSYGIYKLTVNTDCYIRYMIHPTLDIAQYYMLVEGSTISDFPTTYIPHNVAGDYTNLYNYRELIKGRYLELNQTTTSTNAAYACSPWIEVQSGKRYVYEYDSTLYGDNQGAVQLCEYNSSTRTSTISVLTTTKITNKNRYYFSTPTFANDNPRYIRFNVNPASTREMLIQCNITSQFPDIYIPYTNYNQIESPVHLNDIMKTDVSPLFGKKLSVNGDSICFGLGCTGGYAKIIADTYTMRYQNVAVSGGTITYGTKSGEYDRHWICNTITNLDTDADYILIEGGVNDSSLHVALGNLTSKYDDTLDNTTFYGAIESIFKQLTLRFAGKKYGFIIPHQMSIGMSPNGAYYNAIMICGKKWGVPILDLSTQVPPFAWFTSGDLLTLKNIYTNDGDGWHPNEACYRKYYVDKIVKWMESL